MPHDSPLDRRTFMRRIAGVSVGAVATRAPLGLASWNTLHPNYFAVAAEPRALDALRIGLVAVASSSARETDIASFRDGAELGIEKSSRAATLLNKRLEVAPW